MELPLPKADRRKRGGKAGSPTSMRLMLLIDSLEIGGAQRLLETQIKAMSGGIFEIYVINLSRPSPMSHGLRGLGIEVADIDQRRLIDWRALRNVEQLVRRYKPQIIHAHLTHATIIAAVLSKLTQTPLVVTLHSEGSNSRRILATLKTILERLVLSYVVDMVIACGPRVARSQRKRIKETPMRVVANRIEPPPHADPSQRSRLRRSLGYDAEDIVIISVGRLTAEKGFDVLIEAFSNTSGKHPSAKLLIVGDGDYHDDLLQLIGQRGMAQRVRLAGARSDVDQLMAAADIFALASRREGLPMVLLEAMACGLPVIVTDVGDMSTLVANGAGLLINPSDIPGMTAAISDLVENSNRRAEMSMRAWEAIQPYTDVAGFAQEIQAVYDDVIQRKHTR